MSKKKKPTAPAAPKKAPTADEIDERAAALAGAVLAECGQDEHDDLGVPPLALDAPHLVARFLVRDHCQFGPPRSQVVERALGLELNSCLSGKGVAAAEAKLAALNPGPVLSVCLRLCAEVELLAAGRGPFAGSFLALAELDWEQLRGQAVRELGGGEPAAEKVLRAEATLFDDIAETPAGA